MDSKDSSSPSMSSERFLNYYAMMLSVIHGLVLGGAVIGLTSDVFANLGHTPRWIATFLYTLTTDWKYLTKAYILNWEIDLFDMVIPSVLGIALAASFITVGRPDEWVSVTLLVFLAGISAGVYAHSKPAKYISGAQTPYRRNLRLNVVGGSLIIISFVVWRLVDSDAFVPPAATLILLGFSIAQVVIEYRLWRKMKAV